MAAQNPVRNLCEEVTCSICLEYFRDPVMIDCGHNFCQSCISECFEKAEEGNSCPQCREIVRPHKMKLNRPLASIVEISKNFSLQTSRGAEAVGTSCQKHQEPLKLFCKDEQALICVVCDKSREHRGHKVIPKEEAFEEYKDEVSKRLQVLREEREATVLSRMKEENEQQKLLEQTETERQKIVAEFKKMHEFLEEKERVLLEQLTDLEYVIKYAGNGRIAELSEKIESLEGFIVEMEEKQKQPENDFFEDLGATLERCTTGLDKAPFTYPLKVKEEIEKFSKINISLNAITKDFKVIFTTKPNDQNGALTTYLQKKEAYRPKVIQVPNLHLLERINHPKLKSPVYHFQQLSSWSYIVGTENITSGCQSWELDMDIMGYPYWAFGLVGMDRTGHRRIWAFGKKDENKPTVFTSDNADLHEWPREWVIIATFCISRTLTTGKLRVSLDYERHSIVFLHATNGTIHSFKNVIWRGEKICFWYGVGLKNSGW